MQNASQALWMWKQAEIPGIFKIQANSYFVDKFVVKMIYFVVI